LPVAGNGWHADALSVVDRSLSHPSSSSSQKSDPSRLNLSQR
jgi:hypothetical protein